MNEGATLIYIGMEKTMQEIFYIFMDSTIQVQNVVGMPTIEFLYEKGKK